MFCSNCGAKINDNAKFCFNCGSKIQMFSMENKYDDNVKLVDCIEVGEHFEIDGNTIIFVDKINENVLYRKPFNQNGFLQKQRINSFYRENVNDFNSAYTVAIPESLAYIEDTVGMAVNVLIENNVFDYDVDSFLKRFGIGYEFIRDIDLLIQKYNEIDSYSNQLGQARKIQRAGRSKWEGGGFGLGGAIKGSIMAGVLNTGTGIFRGIGDSIMDSRDSNKILCMKQEAFKQIDYKGVIANAVYQANLRIGYYLCCILHENNIINSVIPICDEDILKRKLENIEKKYLSGSVSKDDLIQIVGSWITDNPFSCLYYNFLFSTINADDKGISQICTYLGFDKEYEDLKTAYITQKIQILESKQMDDAIVAEYEDLKQLCKYCDLPIVEKKKLDALQYEIDKHLLIESEVSNFEARNNGSESQVNELIEQGRYSDVWSIINGDNGYAEWKLTEYYSKLVAPYVERIDFKKIEQILAVAYESAEMGNPYAKYLVNKTRRDCYFRMGNKDKIIRVDENLLELAEQGQISASATVGFLQYQGDVFFKKNKKKAFEFLLYASEKNHPMAMDWLGVLYLDGLGTDKDINKARKWLELAAYYGREHAKNLIKKI